MLSIGSEEQLLALEGPDGPALSPAKESAVINAVDAISALLGTFFRVGTRIALNRWTEADTAGLLNAIPLNQDGARNRSASLHRLLVDRYTRGRLVDLSGQLNKQLFMEGATLGAERALKAFKLEENHMKRKIKILFLAANPTDASALRLGVESRQIREMISFGSKRDSFELIQEHAVRVGDLQRVLLTHKPHIVHFCGHGRRTEELVFENDQGTSQVVNKDALVKLFTILKDNLRVVVLNACFSKPQAEALREIIDYTIGMKEAVGDTMAINFAGAFYQALAFDRTVTEGFELAKVEVDMRNLGGADTPELFVHADADVKRRFLAPPE